MRSEAMCNGMCDLTVVPTNVCIKRKSVQDANGENYEQYLKCPRETIKIASNKRELGQAAYCKRCKRPGLVCTRRGPRALTRDVQVEMIN